MLALVLMALFAPEGALVEGRVMAAATGAPLTKARVTLRGGGRFYGATTGEEGRFVITGIEPGRYRLTAERNGYIPQSYGTRAPGRPGAEIALTQGEALRDVTLKLTSMAVVSGRITDEDGEPFPRVQVRALRVRWAGGERQFTPVETARSDDRGEFRLFGLAPGRYLVSAEPEGERRRGERPRYVRLYYPGVYDTREAQILEITGGNELRGTDFRFGPVATVSITGRVLSPQPGRPRGVVVFANRADSPVRDYTVNTIVMDSEGAFEVRGLVPGPYILTARSQSGPSAGVGQVRVDVGESGAQGVVIPIGPEFRLTGRVRGPSGAVASTVIVSLQPRAGGGGRTARADASGNFAFTRVSPDVYRVEATGLPEGTWLSGFRMGTTDLPSSEIDLTQDPGVPLEVVLSDGAASIEGLVLDDSEKPVVGAAVALLPPAERFSQQRLLRFDTADQHGRYSITGVAPGEYRLVAWDGLDPDLLQDHDFLRGQLERGERVNIAARDRKSIQLKAAQE